MPKEGSNCICLSLILIGLVSKMGKNCYPQVFLQEYNKYIVKEKMMSKYITDHLEISTDEEISGEKSYDEGNYIEE